MELKKIEEQAKKYFKGNKALKSIFATESGHFFYSRDSRLRFIANSPNPEKPLDFHRNDAAKKEEIEKQGLPEEMPGVKILAVQGFKSIKEVKDCEDLAKVKGIGEKKAEEIKAYLKNFE